MKIHIGFFNIHFYDFDYNFKRSMLRIYRVFHKDSARLSTQYVPFLEISKRISIICKSILLA